MCLLFFAYRMSSTYELVLAANRDEFYRRPTAPLGHLDSQQLILGGRDLEGGGTWLAINRDGRYGAITNYRGPSQAAINPPSRGGIIMEYLHSSLTARDYLHRLHAEGKLYEGFNLVLGDRQGLWYYSNIISEIRELQKGYYGLSNDLLDSPWPKVERGKNLLKPLLVGVDTLDPQAIVSRLQDREPPPDHLLPDTGVGLEREQLLGTIFIESSDYGTRSTAVISLENSGRLFFFERTHEIASSGSATPGDRELNTNLVKH